MLVVILVLELGLYIQFDEIFCSVYDEEVNVNSGVYFDEFIFVGCLLSNVSVNVLRGGYCYWCFGLYVLCIFL